MVGRMHVRVERLVRNSSTLALAAVVGAAFAIGCAVDAVGDGPVATQSEEVLWDSTIKPIPERFLNLKTDGAQNNCSPRTNDDGSTDCADADGLVRRAGWDRAADYYGNVMPGQNTFDDWKARYNFSKRLPGETLNDFRKRTGTVIYYNTTELGFGRELACSETSSVVNGATKKRIGCFVTNYGDSFNSINNPSTDLAAFDTTTKNALVDAINGDRAKNTVVISWDEQRATSYRVQFAAFDGAGSRINKAQLDHMGARPIPQICTSCHGGDWDNAAGMAKNARFLPLITSTVGFYAFPTSNYTLAKQEEQIRVVNNAAYHGGGDTLTARQRELLQRMYATVGNDLAFVGGGTRQVNEESPPPDWRRDQLARDVYRHVALRYCDTCHMAMGGTGGGIAYEALRKATDFTSMVRTFSGAYMGFKANASGCGGTWATSRAALQMPHAENANARFWGQKEFNLNGQPATAAQVTYWYAGIWCDGLQPTLDKWALSAIDVADCGQNSSLLTFNNETDAKVGSNSGRRVDSNNQCTDRCESSIFDFARVMCPGTEQYSNVKGARQECVPDSPGAFYGTCQSCGRTWQPACLQIGPGCRDDFDPKCASRPACEEGYKNPAGFCAIDNLTRKAGVIASQSSTYEVASAARAIDGNRDGNYSSGSVSHTGSQAGAWWRVDLGATKKIKEIDVYNRTDCCFDRLANFKVEYSSDGTGWSLARDFPGTPTQSGVTIINLPAAVIARYVRVVLNGTNNLQLGEVEVWGW
jgi:hypothetical protein